MSKIEKDILRIEQPIGVFYAVKFTAYELLKLSDTSPYTTDLEGNYNGTQRLLDEDRTKEIARFLKGTDSTLPSSIILAANSSNRKNKSDNNDENEDSFESLKDSQRWHIKSNKLIIPSDFKNCLIIDGQHRVRAFEHLSEDEQKRYELLCSLFMDIPNPYQAYIFATININQKPVDKSLSYNLYGYNLDKEEPNSWSPEKLAVSLSRKINKDNESNLFEKVKLITADDDELKKFKENKPWLISSSTFIEGAMSLYSSNYKRDRDELSKTLIYNRKRDSLKPDRTPLRKYYIENNDLLIYEIIKNFFNAFESVFGQKEILFKTTGLQAQFDILKKITATYLEKDKNIGQRYFIEKLQDAKKIDFNNSFFTSASGISRSRIKNSILCKIGIISIESLEKNRDYNEYKSILN
ncbi:DGQHR domain-containing protein [Sphingobacterium faecium]